MPALITANPGAWFGSSGTGSLVIGSGWLGSGGAGGSGAGAGGGDGSSGGASSISATTRVSGSSSVSQLAPPLTVRTPTTFPSSPILLISAVIAPSLRLR